MPARVPLYVQFGCGLCAPDGWRNFDASPTVRFERIPVVGKLYQLNASRFPANVEYGDVVRGLPVPAGGARAIFASHVLEHLPLEDFRKALRNTLQMLEPGGVFRLIVPDLEQLATRYLSSSSSGAASEFVRAIGMGMERRPRGLFGRLRTVFGNSLHLWMWDFKSLADELAQAGFTNIRRGKLGDSRERCFDAVEEPGRFVDSVAVECERPQ
jgi:hypothetical protein